MSVHGSLPLAVTIGDPAGCGPAISHAAWRALQHTPDHAFYVIGPAAILAAYGEIITVETAADVPGVFRDALPVLDTGKVSHLPVPGQPDPYFTPIIIEAIETAVHHIRSGEAGGLVTNPINKAVLYESGFQHPGHTEFLATLCQADRTAQPRPVMMLVGGGLHVALATIHQPLVEAVQTLSVPTLVDIGLVTHKALQQDFGLPTPRLAFSGLNPHAGENGTIGREEIDIINPAAAALRAQGVDISDARSADTLFAEALGGAFDAVIAMTHDQGLIPVKTLDFWGGVNVTLGLPIVRTSPDHGTAYEAAAAGSCRPDSLIAAIRLAANNVARRSNA